MTEAVAKPLRLAGGGGGGGFVAREGGGGGGAAFFPLGAAPDGRTALRYMDATLPCDVVGDSTKSSQDLSGLLRLTAESSDGSTQGRSSGSAPLTRRGGNGRVERWTGSEGVRTARPG